MLNRTEKFRVFGFSAVWLIGMIFLFDLIVHYPVRSEEKEDTGDKVTSLAEQIDEDLANAQNTYDAISKKLSRLPKFVPPENNRLTENEIHQYYQVVEHCWSRFRSYKRNYLQQLPPGFNRGAAMYAQAPALMDLCQIEGLGKAKISRKEFDWVKQRLWEAALFAVLRQLKSGKVKPEEKDQLMTNRNTLCWMLDFKKDANPIQYFPEKLDTSKIPRANVELFLKFKNEVRWRNLNFEKIELDNRDILNAAQALPE